jgi:O-methyltransferase
MDLKELFTLAVGSSRKKRMIWKRHLKRLGNRHGFYIFQDHMVWKDQPFFTAALKRTEGVQGIPDPRSFVLQSCLRSVANVEGDLAECGVRQGRSTLFMLTADLGKRQYHLFDSFAGLSKPGEDDRDEKGRMRWDAGDLTTDEALTRKHLAGHDNVHFHVGWIPQTLPAVADKTFAFVHIDVDLYEPTRYALAFFYERTKKGGMIVCDDYGSAKCPGARKAFDEFLAERPENLIELPTGQAIVYKQ